MIGYTSKTLPNDNSPQVIAELNFLKDPTVENLQTVFFFWRNPEIRQGFNMEIIGFLKDPEYPEIIKYMRQIEISTDVKEYYPRNLKKE